MYIFIDINLFNSSIQFIRAVKGLETEFPKGIGQCGTDAMRFTLAAYLQQVPIHSLLTYNHITDPLGFYLQSIINNIH